MLRFWDYSIRQGLTHNSANFVKGPGRDIPENAEQPHDWGFANSTEEKEDGHGENPCADRDYAIMTTMNRPVWLGVDVSHQWWRMEQFHKCRLLPWLKLDKISKF